MLFLNNESNVYALSLNFSGFGKNVTLHKSPLIKRSAVRGVFDTIMKRPFRSLTQTLLSTILLKKGRSRQNNHTISLCLAKCCVSHIPMVKSPRSGSEKPYTAWSNACLQMHSDLGGLSPCLSPLIVI